MISTAAVTLVQHDLMAAMVTLYRVAQEEERGSITYDDAQYYASLICRIYDDLDIYHLEKEMSE